MGWLRKAKKAVNDTYRGVKAEAMDESKAHKAVGDFVAQAKHLLETERGQMTSESIAAAEGLIREIKELLDRDSKLEAPHWPMVQRELLDNSLDVIHKYQPKLEASPGFWNQLKASINKLVERVTGVKNLLAVEKTVHGADVTFQDKKDTISDLKDEIDSGNFSPR